MVKLCAFDDKKCKNGDVIVISDDLSKHMVNLYRGAGIFASEEPVRQTTKRPINLSPKMVFLY